MISKEKLLNYLRSHPDVGANDMRRDNQAIWYSLRMNYSGAINSAKRDAGVPEKYINHRADLDVKKNTLEMVTYSPDPLSYGQIAEELGCNVHSVMDAARDLRLEKKIIVVKVPKELSSKENPKCIHTRIIKNKKQRISLANEMIENISDRIQEGKRGAKQSITLAMKNSNLPFDVRDMVSNYMREIANGYGKRAQNSLEF